MFFQFSDLHVLVVCNVVKFSWEVMDWKQLQPRGTSPSGRRGRSAIYDPESHSMVIFGGFSPTPQLADWWGVESSFGLSAPHRQPRP